MISFDVRGRTAQPRSYDEQVRDLIMLLLFTNPMERVNRPDFGSGLLQAVHAPAGPELAATIEYTTHAALQRWLSDIVDIHQLRIEAAGNKLLVDLDYTVLRTGDRRTEQLRHEVIR
jgi:phage baseplate assembly protein W